MTNQRNLYIGLMSGTSMDAVDAAVVQFHDHALEVIRFEQFPISSDIQEKVRYISASSSLQKVTELDAVLGHLFADAVVEILAAGKLKAMDVEAIGSHGQTVLHLPGGDYPRTLQIGDPNIIAWRTGITTVADFRRMDIAAGGEGAPLAPAFHAWKFFNPDCDRVILNIGGMANITIIPADRRDVPVIGFDTGPGNALMDGWTQIHSGRDYDHDGQWAASGECNNELLEYLLNDHYFAKVPPKSTGKDYFNEEWLKKALSKINDTISFENVQATLLELSVHSIVDAVNNYAPGAKEILVCGGGVHNKVLMQKLRHALPDLAVSSTSDAGLDPDCIEAVSFAWLAKQRLAGIPANLPSVTGANRQVLLGAVYKS